jgi:outer membrane receptor protein involved in Fe transport
MNRLLRGTASLAVLAIFAAGAANAAAPAAPPKDDATSVTEIVVTAQKREQKLQDVPVEVQSLPAAQLQASGVADIKDLQILTPGLTVTSTSSEAITSARIRGVGTVGDNPGLEDSVGVVIDGVYRPRNGVSFGDLGELDRIEVLEGPQGTTFGENTTAGVINILTKAPSFTFGAQGEATVGNYNAYGGALSVTGPITDQLAGRIFFADRQRDGFYDVNTGIGPRTDSKDQDQNFYTVRGQLLWQPSDMLSVRAIADYTKRDENCCAAVQTITGPSGLILNGLAGGNGVASVADPSSRLAYANRSDGQKIEDRGFQIQADLDLKGINSKLTSITAVREWNNIQGQDTDYSGADILYHPADGSNQTRFNTLTEELRLTGSNARFDWLGGIYLSDEKLHQDTSYFYGTEYTTYISEVLSGGLSPNLLNCLSSSTFTPLCLGNPAYSAPSYTPGPGYTPGQGVEDHYSQEAKSASFFTNDTWKITPALSLTLGVRVNSEHKTLDTHYNNVNGNGAACTGVLNNLGNLVPYLGASNAYTAATLACLNFADPYYSGTGNGLVTHQSQSETNVSDTAKLAYRWSPQVMTYASYAHGFKDGGFNLDRVATSDGTHQGSSIVGVVPVTDTSFKPETTDSYELGVKTTWLRGKLLLDLTGFYQEYKDFQLNQFNGLAFDVDTIPSLTSKGLDGQAQWLTPLPGLTLNAGFTYAMTRFGSFDAAALSFPADFNGIPGINQGLSRLPGARAPFAPLWSSTLGASYDHRIGEGLRFLLAVESKTLSSYNTGSDLDPAKEQSAYTLINARVGIGSADKRWTLEFWSNNLTNQTYYQVVFDGPIQTGTYDAFLGQPRTFGATLRVKY